MNCRMALVGRLKSTNFRQQPSLTTWDEVISWENAAAFCEQQLLKGNTKEGNLERLSTLLSVCLGFGIGGNFQI